MVRLRKIYSENKQQVEKKNCCPEPPKEVVRKIVITKVTNTNEGDVEIYQSEKNLTGQAPSGYKLGINVLNGNIYYVDEYGNWQPYGNLGISLQKKYYTADFDNARQLTDNWLNGKNISIFWNDVARYLYDNEFTLAGNVLTIIADGFDSSVLTDKIIITESLN